MVVSTAFEELTELLRCLETSDAEIREVGLREQSPESGDELTADLIVAVPVLPGVSDDAVSVEASGFEVQNQRIDVDLTVTLPVTDDDVSAAPRERDYGSSVRNGSPVGQSSSIPSYKDPDALQAVYDEYDTFPEMTDALGADVTSETVRRYMVEYDIHDPSENTPQAHALSQLTTDEQSQDDTERNSEPASRTGTSAEDRSSENTSTERRHTASDGNPNTATHESNTATATQPDDTQSTNTQPTSTESTDTESTNTQSASTQSSSTQSANTEPTNTQSANTHSGTGNQSDSPDSSTDDASGEPGESDELGRRSVAEMIAESDSERTDDKLVADGLGIPQDMTVAELADVVNQSNTIYEVTQQLDMKQGNARRLLQKLNLIDFVIHRLAADQINVSHEEIARRIAAHD